MEDVEVRTDPASQRTYYFNRRTSQTVLKDRPATPPAGWRLYADESSGQWYYHHEASNTTSWIRPNDDGSTGLQSGTAASAHVAASPTAASVGTAHDAHIEERFDHSRPPSYFFNKATGQSGWSRQEVGGSHDAAGVGAGAGAAGAAATGAAANITRMTDPATGRTFVVNDATGLTGWSEAEIGGAPSSTAGHARAWHLTGGRGSSTRARGSSPRQRLEWARSEFGHGRAMLAKMKAKAGSAAAFVKDKAEEHKVAERAALASKAGKKVLAAGAAVGGAAATVMPRVSQDWCRNGFGKKRFGDGGTYEGQWQDGKRHGTGTYTFASGNTYEGQYQDDEMHGTGTFTFADGGSWEGPWRDHDPSGPGTWRFPGVGQVAGDGPMLAERADQPAAPTKWRAAAADAEAERKRAAEAEANRRAEAEAKRRAEAEAKRRAEAKAEAKRRALVAKLTGKGFDLSLVEAAIDLLGANNEKGVRKHVAAEHRRRAEAEKKRQAEAEAQRKREAEAEARRQAEAKAEEDRRTREAQAEAQRAAEVEAKREREAEARRKREAKAEAKRRAEAEAERRAEAKAEAKRRALVAKLTGKGFDLSLVEAAIDLLGANNEKGVRKHVAAEHRRRAEAEKKRQAEAEAQRKREAEAEARRQAEAKAEEDRRTREAQAEAQRVAEAEARRQAEAKAEEDRLVAKFTREIEAESKRRADAEAKRRAETQAKRLEAEAKRRAEIEATKARRTLVAKLSREGLKLSLLEAAVDAVGVDDEQGVRDHAAIEQQRRAEAERKRQTEAEAERKRQTEAEAERKREAEARAARVRDEMDASAVPPRDLVGRRINVVGDERGPGTVQGPFKRGKVLGMGASMHTVRFDNGRQEKLVLARHGNGGAAFVLLDDGTGTSSSGGAEADAAAPPPAPHALAQKTRTALAKGGVLLQWKEIPAAELRTNAVPLKQGGFGDVKRIEWRGMLVAKKEIRIASEAGAAKAHKTLVREVRAMAAVRHPNVVTLLGVCVEPGELAIVMEYAEKGTLRDRLDAHIHEPVPAWRRFHLLFGVLNGMRRLHAHTPRPIVHADLKSLNVLVAIDHQTCAWVAKITDFGLASGSGLSTASQSRRAGGGTITHNAPEVLGDGPPSTASDMYSFGIIAWEVAMGLVPFEGKQIGAIVGSITLGKRPPLPASAPPGSVFSADQWRLFAHDIIPGGGSAAAAGCWAQEPDARPAAAALYDQFQAEAARFEPPPGTDAKLWAQAAQQRELLRDDKLDRILRGQEAMHADVRRWAARINGAVNALVSGEADCFRLFWLVPAAAGITLSPKTWLTTTVLLVPLDEHDLQPIVCGPNGDGYPLQLPTKFYKDHAAAIALSYRMLRVSLAVGRLVGLPLPVPPEGSGASLRVQLVNDVCTTVDKNLPGAVKKEMTTAEDALKGSRAIDAKTVAKVTKATGPAYQKLKALLEHEHPSWRASLSATPVSNAAGQVGWVRNENAAAWAARGH
eukprot:g2565.t1